MASAARKQQNNSESSTPPKKKLPVMWKTGIFLTVVWSAVSNVVYLSGAWTITGSGLDNFMHDAGVLSGILAIFLIATAFPYLEN